MFSYILFFGAFLACASAQLNTTNSTTPLNVVLWDLFGDTWEGAVFSLEKADGFQYETAPDCEHNPRLIRILPTITGLYYLVVHTHDNKKPKEYWEIFWTAQVGDNGEKHSGHFNTTMVWHYNRPTDTWTLAFFNNLIDNEKDVCDDACSIVGESKVCPPPPPKPELPPPPKPEGPPPQKPEGPSHNADGNQTSSDTHETNSVDNSTSSSNSTEVDEVELKAPKYGPPAVNVPVHMFDEEADGWWKNNYLGASWYIYDATRTELFHQGTLCDAAKGNCKLCLGDGPYLFRATGDKKVLFQESDWVVVDHNTHETSGNATKDQDFIAWDFCGVRGRYYDELHFHVKKGKCIPDYIVPLDDICAHAFVHATVKIAGSLSVSGVASQIMTEADAKLVVSTLVQELPGLQYTDITILSSTLENTVSKTYTHVVNFQVAFDTEKTFGFNGKSVSAIENLVSSLQTTLESEIASGAFVSAMTSLASTNAANSMTAVSEVSLLSFELISASYTGSRPIEYSKLSAAVVETSVNPTHDFVSIAMFLAVIGVGVVAFVGVISSKYSTRYSQVVQESTHDVSEVVMSSEIDVSLSRPDVRVVSERNNISL